MILAAVPASARALLHEGGLGWDELVLYLVPLLVGLVLYWAMSRFKAPPDAADSGDAPAATGTGPEGHVDD